MALQIFTTDGRVVGQIDHTRGVKHRLTLPKEMPINQKILLLFFMITMVSVKFYNMFPYCCNNVLGSLHGVVTACLTKYPQIRV